MRVLVLALLGSLVAAGCMEERPHFDDLQSPREAEGPAEPAAQVPAAGAVPVRPKVDVHLLHDFSKSDATHTFEIPEGAGHVQVQVGFRMPQGASACSSYGSEITVTDPEGKVWKQLEGGGLMVGGSNSCGSQTSHGRPDWKTGTWTVRFAGQSMSEGYLRASNAN